MKKLWRGLAVSVLLGLLVAIITLPQDAQGVTLAASHPRQPAAAFLTPFPTPNPATSESPLPDNVILPGQIDRERTRRSQSPTLTAAQDAAQDANRDIDPNVAAMAAEGDNWCVPLSIYANRRWQALPKR